MHVDTSRPSFGLASQRGGGERMSVAHQHDDIEFNYAPSPMTYRIDGTIVPIPAGRIVAFWAARPHQLIESAPGQWVHWLTVPLGLMLAWSTPEGLTGRLLRGEVLLVDEVPALAPPIDRLTQWSADLATGDAWTEGTVRLEIEAYLRRLVVEPLTSTMPTGAGRIGPHASSLAGLMAAYVAARSAEPITVADVARAVHVHPGYAMTVFRRDVGTTIGSYLTQCRIAHAQRLLLTSKLSVQEISSLVGFQSSSQFYDRFRAACATTPTLYRRLHITPNGTAESNPDAPGGPVV